MLMSPRSLPSQLITPGRGDGGGGCEPHPPPMHSPGGGPGVQEERSRVNTFQKHPWRSRKAACYSLICSGKRLGHLPGTVWAWPEVPKNWG